MVYHFAILCKFTDVSYQHYQICSSFTAFQLYIMQRVILQYKITQTTHCNKKPTDVSVSECHVQH